MNDAGLARRIAGRGGGQYAGNPDEDVATPAAELPPAREAFLVGAGRSGTTLLYKLLCLHPAIAYISNYETRLGWFPDGLACRAVAWRPDEKLQAWFNQRGNAYFSARPWLKRVLPTPHEGEKVFASAGMPLFPARDEPPGEQTIRRLRARFERLRRRAGASVLVSKRTANNRRIPQLERIFPHARYIHLVRDGRAVARSLSNVEWWDGHTVWWDGRTAADMERSGEPRLAICAQNWVRELAEVRDQLAHVAPERVLELRFEELLADPLRHLERILRFLDVESLALFRAAVLSLNLRPVEAQWHKAWDAEQLACVLDVTRPMLRDLGYHA